MSAPETVFKNLLNLDAQILGNGVSVSGYRPRREDHCSNHIIGSSPFFLGLCPDEKILTFSGWPVQKSHAWMVPKEGAVPPAFGSAVEPQSA